MHTVRDVLISALLPLLLASTSPDVSFLSPHYEDAERHRLDPPVQYVVPPLVKSKRQELQAADPLVPSKLVYGFLPYWVKTDPNTFRWSVLTHVIYFSAELSEVGDIKTTHGLFDATGRSPIVEIAHRNQRKALISIYVPGDLSGLLRQPARRANAIQNLVALAQKANADGIDIDFEPVKPEQAEDLITFMRDFSAAFRTALPKGEITMDVYAWPTNYPGYDIRRLEPFVDRFLVMAYNYHWKGSARAGPNSPLAGAKVWKWNVQRSMEDPTGYRAMASVSKLILGVPYYGFDWPVAAASPVPTNTTGKGYTRFVNELISQGQNIRQWDTESLTPYFNYTDARGARQVWYEDAESLSLKYDYVNRTGLPGVMIWALGYDEGRPEVWDTLVKAFPLVPASTLKPAEPKPEPQPEPEPPVTSVTLPEAGAAATTTTPASTVPESPPTVEVELPSEAPQKTGCSATSLWPMVPGAALSLLLRRRRILRPLPSPGTSPSGR